MGCIRSSWGLSRPYYLIISINYNTNTGTQAVRYLLVFWYLKGRERYNRKMFILPWSLCHYSIIGICIGNVIVFSLSFLTISGCRSSYLHLSTLCYHWYSALSIPLLLVLKILPAQSLATKVASAVSKLPSIARLSTYSAHPSSGSPCSTETAHKSTDSPSSGYKYPPSATFSSPAAKAVTLQFFNYVICSSF